MDELIDPIGMNNGNTNYFQPKTLPNATTVLVLGIISIAGCLFWGIPGIVCGIIAIVLHKKDKALYETDVQAYEMSFKSSRAGQICGIVGLCLSVLCLVFMVFYIYFIVDLVSKTPYH